MPRSYRYRVDFEGRIFHAGTEIDDPLAIRQLLGRVHRDDDGRPYASCMGEWLYLDADDVLYVVQSYEARPEDAARGRLPVRCQAGVRRVLDLGSLELVEETFLYGMLADGHRARFGRRAHLEFVAEQVVEDAGQGFRAVVGGWSFSIARR